MFRMFLSTALWHLLSIYVPGADSELRQNYLKRAKGEQCQTFQIGDPWTASSPITCYAECMVRFPDTCQSIVYNAETKTCRPGSKAFGRLKRVNTGIPQAASNDSIYYSSQPIPPCPAGQDFTIYDVCGTSSCLFLSTNVSQADYDDARANCSQMSSRLFIANTMEKFSLIWYITKHIFQTEAWVALTDRAQPNVFRWEDGSLLSSAQNDYVWDKWQPDGDGDCVQFRVTDLWNPEGLNDQRCWKLNHYVCEPI